MRLRAPSDDGATLLVPAWEELPGAVERNRALPAGWQVDILGRSLVGLIREARMSLIAAAIHYTSQYRDLSPGIASSPIDSLAVRPLVMAGHQPQLFHPGVWLKNFALGELAQRTGGIALNLLVDGDTLKSAALPVPTGSVDKPERVLIPFDDTDAEIPYEERSIRNPELFASLGRRVSEHLRPLVSNPWIEEYWPAAVERGRATGNVGLAFAQSRHQLEAQHGLTTLELPQSAMCRLPVFQVFLAHLLGNLGPLRDLYNQAIRDFRNLNHLRSANHPAPELAADDVWIETPLWIWSAAQPRRRHCFVSRRDSKLILTDRGDWQATIPDPLQDADGAVTALADLESRGIKLRTRALLTTLFARVFLSDLFIHGIGGGKYDAVTDQLIHGIFGVNPPRFAIATGTLRLPIERPRVSLDDLRQNVEQRRALVYHPEQFLDGMASPEVNSYLEQKRSWIAVEPDMSNARQRCQAIRGANAALQAYLAPQRLRLQSEDEELERRWRNELLLGSREYPWPWYPSTSLLHFLLAFRQRRS